MDRVDVPDPVTIDWLVAQMRDKRVGTEGALDSLIQSLDGADTLTEVGAFMAAYIVRLTRFLEKTRIGSTNVLSRGRIARLTMNALSEVRGTTDDEIFDPRFNCPECRGECGVTSIKDTEVTLRCRKCCHEFTRRIH